MATPPTLPDGYFGEEGSFSHAVARRLLPHKTLVSLATQSEAFQQLKTGRVSSILVPIENARSGIITETVEELVALAAEGDDRFQILECATLKVKLALLAKSQTVPVKVIYSHAAPFVHARSWLKTHYPQAKLVVVTSTSAAARGAASEKGAAAIAGEHAAALYGLKILHQDLAAGIKNQTQFFRIGSSTKTVKGTHTTLVFELPHRPGSLVSILTSISSRGLNLTRIVSHPIPGRLREYRFMIEFEGTSSEPKTAKALKEIQAIAPLYKNLGTYKIRKV
jgi:prephenate dehydratase